MHASLQRYFKLLIHCFLKGISEVVVVGVINEDTFSTIDQTTKRPNFDF